ncbi:DUF4189 domain-containing protein [Nocardia sp. NPDC050710]|uniref:DUF4189 domain-containing protein n=1 Tax=Nocardia sp. NPDC050710 TaxID=3157220 RepID=UPI0033F2CE3D
MSYPHGQYPGQPYQPPGQGQPYPPGPSQPYPPGPQMGQPFPAPPPYPPGGSGGGGGGKVAAVLVSILVGVLAIAAIIGLRVVKNQAKNEARHARDGHSTSQRSAPPSLELPSFTTAPPTRTTTTRPAPPPPTRSDIWIAATYNSVTDRVSWTRSSIGSEHASAEVESACGPGCPPARWSRNGCIALAIGQRGGWGSEWGNTIPEAESKAIAFARNIGVSGPFNLWSKCAFE